MRRGHDKTATFKSNSQRPIKDTSKDLSKTLQKTTQKELTKVTLEVTLEVTPKDHIKTLQKVK